MKIKIIKKHNNPMVWYNNYVNKEFECLVYPTIGAIKVKLPNLHFKPPILGLVWVKNRRFTHGLILKGDYELVKE